MRCSCLPSLLAFAACLFAPAGAIFAQEDASFRLELGGHIGNVGGFGESDFVLETFYGLDGRLYLLGLSESIAVDAIVSYYPVDETVSRTTVSIFGSWVFTRTRRFEASVGPGFEYLHERFDFDDETLADSYTSVGVRVEGKYMLSDHISPIVDLKAMGSESVYVGGKVGVRIKII